MSEVLRVEQVAVDRWGRASGFELNLPKDNFVVLHGPNESGKSSLATALVWLIAGPGSRQLLQRFGVEGEMLSARLSGHLGSESLKIEANAKVPRAGSRAVASEIFEASIGTTPVRRADLTDRLGVGDFDSFRRFYWVEALDVADGSNLQESVSVQAMFGGVNPFRESDKLSAAAKNLLGAPKGRASSGSARELHHQAKSLSRNLRTLSGAKNEWVRIEASISTANSQREETKSELAALQEDFASLRLALAAFTQGRVESRDTAANALSNAPKPTARDEYLHEQASLARERIGDLRSAQNEVESARRALQAATDAVHGNWRPLIDTEALGEAGLAAADEAERRLRDSCDQEHQAEIERNVADERARTSQTDFDSRADEWRQRAPDRLVPDSVATTSDAELAESDHRHTDALASATGRLREPFWIAALVVAVTCIVTLGAVSTAEGQWPMAAVALLGGLALSAVLVAALRNQKPWDPALIELARAYKSARNERDAACKALGDMQRNLERQNARVNSSRKEYRQSMKALGVPYELIERFQPDAARHLKAVHKAQSESAGLARAQETRTRRLEEVCNLFTGGLTASEYAGEPERTPETPSEATPQCHDVESQARSATATVELRDAAEAQVRLKRICDRVDEYRAAVRAAGEADISLRQAVQHNETALSYIERSTPEALRTRESALDNERHRLEAELERTEEKITDLGVEKRQLESSDNQAAMLSLEHSELSARIEDVVVQGLGQHLAASLLRDAAEQHRMERQPELLRRIREMGCEVADWTGVTVNPHAVDASSSADQADNLLVDGPRGEHPAHRLSLGAQTLLYLSLRLATVEKQANVRGVHLPVILDDVLIGLDDQRSDRVLGLLSKFSERCQLILLTCHERTKQRAQAAGAFFLPVPPP